MTTALSAGHTSMMVIAEEADKGTSPAIATGLRDNFTADPGITAVQKTIRLGENMQDRYNKGHVMTSYHMAGSVPQMVTPNGHIGYWLGMAIGDPSSAQQGGTAAYKHTYTPDDDLKTFSMWYARGGNQQVVIPYGAVDTLLIEQSPSDVLRSTVGIIGQKETINADDMTTADAYDTARKFHDAHLTVTGPVGATEVFSSSILVNNKYNVDKGRAHGSRFYNALIPGKREVTGTMELWFDDDGDYQNFWGSTSETTPDVAGDFTPIPLNFSWDSGELADTGFNYILALDVPEVAFEATNVIMEERIRQTIDWSAQYDTGDSYDIQAELTNTVVSYP